MWLLWRLVSFITPPQDLFDVFGNGEKFELNIETHKCDPQT